MKLYDLKAGMNPRRVRIFLAEKGLSLPMVAIDMAKGENHTPDFLAKNPLGKMPVLELDDGTVITESIAICRYLDELHPEPNLFGATPLERATIEMWNRRVELELLKPISDQFRHLSPFWVGRVEQIAVWGEASRTQAFAAMAWLDRELGERGFIAGQRYTVADITAQCALLLGKNTGAPIPQELTHLSRWFAEVSQRPTARA